MAPSETDGVEGRSPLRRIMRRFAGLGGTLRARLADRSDRAVAQRAAGSAFLIRVASAGILFVSQILLARWMGRYEFGIYVSVWAWASVLGPLSQLGLAYAAQRFIPAYRHAGDQDGLRGFLAGSRLLSLAFGMVAGGVLGAIMLLAGDRGSGHVVVPFLVAAATLPAFTVAMTQDGVARSFDWIDLALVPVFIVQPLLILVVMAGSHLAGGPMDAVAVLTVTGAAMWLVTAGQAVLIGRRLGGVVEPGRRRFEPVAWLKVSLPICLVDGFGLVLFYVDMLVLQALAPPQDVAVYFAASKTLALVHFVTYAVGAAVAHRFSALHAAGDRAGLDAFVIDATRWTFWPTVAIGLVLVALAKPILMLFGPGFEAGAPLIAVIVIGLVARGAVGPAERLLNMTGHSGVCAAVYATALAVNLTLCLLLIPRFGLIGAAAAMATSVVVESTLLFAMVKRRLGLTAFVFRRKTRQAG